MDDLSHIAVEVVIVNYRSEDVLIDCLDSLAPERQELPGLSAGICENGGGPSVVAAIRGALDRRAFSWARVLPSPTNLGFAAGANMVLRDAIDHTAPDYFLLLNPDTVVQRGAVSALVGAMERDPTLGMVNAQLTDLDGTRQQVHFRDITGTTEFLRAAETGALNRLLGFEASPLSLSGSGDEDSWLCLAGTLVRRAVVEQIGLLDENFFLYFEDLDYSRRVRAAGWRLACCADAHIVHFVGRSSDIQTAARDGRRRPRFYYAGRSRYLAKAYGRRRLWMINLCWHAGRTVSWLREFTGTKSTHLCSNEAVDLWTSCWAPVERRKPGNTRSGERLTRRTGREDRAGDHLSLLAQLREDYVAHRSDWRLPGFRAVAIHRFGQWRMSLKPKLVRAPFSVVYRCLYRYARNVYGIELPYSVELGRRVVIEHQGGVVIHGSARIGDDCVIRQGVTMGIKDVRYPDQAPTLAESVDVGVGAVILGAVHVGAGARIGANAVVVSDVEPGVTVTGVPARVHSTGP